MTGAEANGESQVSLSSDVRSLNNSSAFVDDADLPP